MNLSQGLKFFLNRMREKLWLKPLMLCLLSVVAAFIAGMADDVIQPSSVPEISLESIKELLSILSSSMLVIAVFAVGAMISAYTSASNSATPRAFAVVVADDVSQNALSTFIGAFIYGNVALVALLNGYYERAGRFALFLLTVVVFAFVILSFVRWVDRIARLGRMGNTIYKVEKAVEAALKIHARHPALGAKVATGKPDGQPVYAKPVGYIQRINVAMLQEFASKHNVEVIVSAMPGTFLSPGTPLACIDGEEAGKIIEQEADTLVDAFIIGDDRTFDEDPRFGIVVLSEIASRALSPAVNDPGTAFEIIDTMVRLFDLWYREARLNEPKVLYDAVMIQPVSVEDFFDDAFSAISRDSAAMVEVQVRLQRALDSLATHEGLRDAAITHGERALRHAESALKLEEDKEWLRSASKWMARDRV